MDTELRICLQCKEPFQAPLRDLKRGRAKFCTLSCSAKFNGRNRSESILPNVECAWCKKAFHKNASKQSKSRSGLFFCCRVCKDEAQRIDGIKAIQPPHYGSGTASYREIAYRVHPKVCMRCAWDKHPAGIVVHHIDRNRQNNQIENLEVLCATCHAIEHHGEDND